MRGYFSVILLGLIAVVPARAGDTEDIPVLRGVLRQGDVRVELDGGRVLIGSKGKVRIDVANESGIDIDAAIKPACNCTPLTSENVKAKAGETLHYGVEYKVPPTSGRFGADIICRDSSTGTQFTVAVVFEAVTPVTIGPEKLTVGSGAREHQPVTVKAAGVFDTIKITGMVVTESPVAEAASSDSRELVVRMSPSRGQMEDVLSVQVMYVNDADGSSGTIISSVPIEYPGIAKLAPKVLQVRKSGDGFAVTANLVGLVGATLASDLACTLTVDGTATAGRVVEVTDRNPRMRRVVMLFPMAFDGVLFGTDAEIVLSREGDNGFTVKANGKFVE